MKTKFTQQEILLITGTRFLQKEWCEKEDTKKSLSATEQLENACWNGVLDEMLPEIMQKTSEGKSLFLWHIRHCRSFLELELSESSPVIDRQFSIDPYLFTHFQILN